MTPALQALKDALPHLRLAVLDGRPSATSSPATRRWTSCWCWRAAAALGDIRRRLAMGLSLRRHRFDLVLNYHGGSTSAFLVRMAGAPWRASYPIPQPAALHPPGRRPGAPLRRPRASPWSTSWRSWRNWGSPSRPRPRAVRARARRGGSARGGAPGRPRAWPPAASCWCTPRRRWRRSGGPRPVRRLHRPSARGVPGARRGAQRRAARAATLDGGGNRRRRAAAALRIFPSPGWPP